MTKAQVEANSACWCFTGIGFERAATYLLSQILAGGGGGSASGTTNMALAGLEPPSDGSVLTYFVFDTDDEFLWYNSATLAAPVWKNV